MKALRMIDATIITGALLGFSGVILVFFGITGDAILRFFDICLPAFEIAGGFIFFIYSVAFLADDITVSLTIIFS